MPVIRTRVLAVALASVFASTLVLSSTPASAASAAGQLCASSKVGTTDKDASGATITCKKDGTRFRWTAGGAAAATKAPATTKAPGTTKKPSTAATTTKAGAKAAAPAPAAATGAPVNGRFCAAADKGKTDKDKNGVTLTCKAGTGGKFRWTK